MLIWPPASSSSTVVTRSRRGPGKVLAESCFDHHLRSTMTDIREKRLIEALRKVEVHGDVAPGHVHDPMTMLLRQQAVQAGLMRWDDSRGHYVLTGTGRSRISGRNRGPGAVIRLAVRNGKDGGSTPEGN